MSGHSKWSNIKNQKQATDKARAQIFTKLSNAITITVKESGGVTDPQSNFKLRLYMEKARNANMPKNNIQRAIDRALGKGGNQLELSEVIYEGFGHNGIAVMIEAVTDNKQRIVSEIKNTFMRFGGHLGGTGSVAYLFKKVGEVHLTKTLNYDQMLELVLEISADDLEEETDKFTVICGPHKLHLVKEFFLTKNISILDSEISFKPTTFIEITDKNILQTTVNLLTALEELPDVHKVYANFSTKIDL